MYLKVSNRNTRPYLALVKGVHDKVTKNSRTVTVEALGYLDVLQKEYDDPIAHFREVARRRTLEEREQAPAKMPLQLDMQERLEVNQSLAKLVGYFPFVKFYHELGIDTFIRDRHRYKKAGFNANAILRLLVYGRLLFPGSKKKTYEQRHLLFEKSDFSLEQVYRCLPFLAEVKEALLAHLHKRLCQRGRDTTLVYYDVTNYYFEIDREDEWRRNGVGKQRRDLPLIQMGLFVDNDGLPIHYQLFSGNTPDIATLRDGFKTIAHSYGIERTIVVADRGIHSGDNLYFLVSGKNGYIVGASIRGASQAVKDYVLEQDGFVMTSKTDKMKARMAPRDVWVTLQNGKKATRTLHEQQVITYSQAYADRARYERERAIERAKAIIKQPKQYQKKQVGSAGKYIVNLTYDKKSGEILDNAQSLLYLDDVRIQEEAQYDGYFMVYTSEQFMEPAEVMQRYHGLWQIEEAFKITKLDLATRPIHVTLEEHIEAHFLTCFIALLLARLMAKELNSDIPLRTMLNELKRATCTLIGDNIYAFETLTEALLVIGRHYDIPFDRRFMQYGDILKIQARLKKS